MVVEHAVEFTRGDLPSPHEKREPMISNRETRVAHGEVCVAVAQPNDGGIDFPRLCVAGRPAEEGDEHEGDEGGTR